MPRPETVTLVYFKKNHFNCLQVSIVGIYIVLVKIYMFYTKYLLSGINTFLIKAHFLSSNAYRTNNWQ